MADNYNSKIRAETEAVQARSEDIISDGYEYRRPEETSPKYRFFVHPRSVERLRAAIYKGNAWYYGFAFNWGLGINIEVIPVLEEIVEADPETAGKYVEVKFEMGDEG